jgi:hypothetical protein
VPSLEHDLLPIHTPAYLQPDRPRVLELDSGPQCAQSTERLFTVIAGEADYPATQLQAD